jgi:hypothetical protein
MAEAKDGEQAQPRRAPQPGPAVAQRPGTADPTGRPAWETSGPGTIATRKRQFLIGIRNWPGYAPPAIEPVLQALRAMEAVEIVRHVPARGLSAGLSGSDIVIVRMDEPRGEALRRTAPPHLAVEPDTVLQCADALFDTGVSAPLDGRLMPIPCRGSSLAIRVAGDGDRPLADASVILYGSGIPVQAMSDPSGQAVLTPLDAETRLRDGARALCATGGRSLGPVRHRTAARRATPQLVTHHRRPAYRPVAHGPALECRQSDQGPSDQGIGARLHPDGEISPDCLK